jgi:hypothetical protein
MMASYLMIGVDKPRRDIIIIIGLLTNGMNKNSISIRKKGEK